MSYQWCKQLFLCCIPIAKVSIIDEATKLHVAWYLVIRVTHHIPNFFWFWAIKGGNGIAICLKAAVLHPSPEQSSGMIVFLQLPLTLIERFCFYQDVCNNGRPFAIWATKCGGDTFTIYNLENDLQMNYALGNVWLVFLSNSAYSILLPLFHWSIAIW